MFGLHEYPGDVESRAAAGDPDCMLQLAAQRAHAGDREQAVTWYRRAAAEGIEEAMNNLAVALLANNAGRARDEEAVEWLRRASEVIDHMHYLPQRIQ